MWRNLAGSFPVGAASQTCESVGPFRDGPTNTPRNATKVRQLFRRFTQGQAGWAIDLPGPVVGYLKVTGMELLVRAVADGAAVIHVPPMLSCAVR